MSTQHHHQRATARANPWLQLTVPAVALLSILAGSLIILLVYSFYSFERGQIIEQVTLTTWVTVLGDPFFWSILLRTVTMAGVVTVVSLLLGYPIAYGITRIRNEWLLAAVYVTFFSPLIVGIVVRSYGWILLLSDSGLVNGLLTWAGLISRPLPLIFNLTGVQVALIQGSMSLMIFPLVSALRSVDHTFKEAAMDLGASRFETFRRVTLPLTLPGLIAGCQIVFVLAASAWVTPELLGGGRVITMARLAYEDVTSLNWPRGAIEVFAVLLAALVLVLASNFLARLTYLGAARTKA